MTSLLEDAWKVVKYAINLSSARRETLKPPFPPREAGWFHTVREKTKIDFKASPPRGERFREGLKNHSTQREIIFLFSYETPIPS
jgi:hypothetical protein